MRRITHHILVFIAACLLWLPADAGIAATQPSWNPLATACLPTRAAKWVDGTPESAQPSCHCPPSSMCPTTTTDYNAVLGAYKDSRYDATKMPPSIFSRCCSAPVCPSGSRLEGQPIPLDNICNPVCPAGTGLQGQILPADTICNRCPAGTTHAGSVYGNISDCTYVPPPPSYCPAGSVLAGQIMPSDGNCNPCERVYVQPHGQPYVRRSDQCACPTSLDCYAGSCWPAYHTFGATLYGGTNNLVGDYVNGFAVLDEHGNSFVPSSTISLTACITDQFLSGGSCFSADAQLERPDGTKVAIADLKINDEIIGREGVAKVRALNHYEQRSPIFFRINDLPFLITGDHPVETKDGFKTISAMQGSSRKLKAGDVLITKNGKREVISITRIAQPNQTATYNLAVDGDKPVYVGGISVKPFTELRMKY